MRSLHATIFFVLCLSLSACCTAGLSGQVTDYDSKTPVADARVVLPDLGLEAVADGDGRYAFFEVPCGSGITIKANADDYPEVFGKVNLDGPVVKDMVLQLRKEEGGERKAPKKQRMLREGEYDDELEGR